MQKLSSNIGTIVRLFEEQGKPLDKHELLELFPTISYSARQDKRLEAMRDRLNRMVAMGVLSKKKGAKAVLIYELTPYYKSILAQYNIAPEIKPPVRVIPQSARPDISTVWRFPI